LIFLKNAIPFWEIKTIGNMEPNSLKSKLNEIKDSVLNRVLIVIMFVMVLGITFSLLRIPQTGFLFTYGVQLFLALVIASLYIFRNKLSSNLKGAIFLSVMLILALSGLLSFGLYGFGYTYFIPASAVAFIYFKRRTGWAVTLSSLFVLVVIAVFFNRGILYFSPQKPDYMESVSMWLNMIITVTLIASVITMFWSNLFSLLSNTLTHINHQQEDMMRMNEQLTLARDKALESDRLKSAFLANISHEIRTPLNIIIGFSDMLSQAETQVEKEEYTQVIKNNSAMMLKMVNDIVDFSKIETNSLALNQTKFKVADVIREVEKKVLWKKPESVEWTCKAENSELVTDKDRFGQVVLNLADNALKFTSEGRVELSCSAEGGKIVCKVADTGIGISGDDESRIFERFYKVDTFVPGAGLGLSISKSIANMMGGDIHVYSEQGKGSVFEFWIPCNSN